MNTIYKNILLFILLAFCGINMQAQEKAVAKDSIPSSNSEQGGDRNVMLNAASANAGPRDVNIGLPASVGGTTILENDLPVVYYYWPELPYKAWRMDAMTDGVKLLDLGQTAINISDVGFSVGTYDNLGTDKTEGNVFFNSNHFGLLNGSANISGPLNRKGLKYSVGAFVNFDPGTYSVDRNHIDKYYNDKTQLYKIALTQDYRFNGGKGSVTALYKYANVKSMTMKQYAPYHYYLDGSVKEIDGFKAGQDNYIASQKFTVRDAETGEIAERDGMDDYGTDSHTLDIIGKNRWDNGLYFNYNIRLHSGKSGLYLPIMTQIHEQTYTNTEGTQETGNLQDVMILASRRTPLRNLSSLFEMGKRWKNHEWKAGLNEWIYNVDHFVTEGGRYSQTVEPDPQRIPGTETYGIYEYHNGTENKTALILTDKWDVCDVVTLNLGARLEYHRMRGDYINNKENEGSTEPLLSRKRTDIKHDFFNKAFVASGIFKVTKGLGFLAEVTYNEQSGHLENYSGGNDPNLKKSKIPGAGLGLFFNHDLFSIVSKATYIQRDEYRATVTFTSLTGSVNRPTVAYDIKTLGWTTDVVATPFKNFNLHFLFTLQSPKYKRYGGTVNFPSGESIDYNFEGNTVTSVSKVLIEIDPSYQWKGLRVWASARYFSKQYANLTNSLYFKGRWETFAGASYAFKKHLELKATVVNLLNQRGAQGTISGADLYTSQDVTDGKIKDGQVLSGTYIRPFTVEFGVKYKF